MPLIPTKTRSERTWYTPSRSVATTSHYRRNWSVCFVDTLPNRFDMVVLSFVSGGFWGAVDQQLEAIITPHRAVSPIRADSTKATKGDNNWHAKAKRGRLDAQRAVLPACVCESTWSKNSLLHNDRTHSDTCCAAEKSHGALLRLDVRYL
jgi:hypothetical protein